jgi:hypothetical protein
MCAAKKINKRHGAYSRKYDMSHNFTLKSVLVYCSPPSVLLKYLTNAGIKTIVDEHVCDRCKIMQIYNLSPEETF